MKSFDQDVEAAQKEAEGKKRGWKFYAKKYKLTRDVLQRCFKSAWKKIENGLDEPDENKSGCGPFAPKQPLRGRY